jgi:hypothetical protein
MMVINKRIKIYRLLIFLFFLISILQISLSATTFNKYPEWKIKLSYMLMSKGKEFLDENPELALSYFQRAKKIYPQNKEVKELIEKALNEVENPSRSKNLIEERPSPKVYHVQETSPESQSVKPAILKNEHKVQNHSQSIENQNIEKKPDKEKTIISRNVSKKLPQGKNIIIAEYKGVSEEEEYKAEEKGPTVNTILDPYHPRHKGMSIPYYKDREGLKIHPWVGIRGEYMYEEQPVGIESLAQEAQEYNQRSDTQAAEYISVNKKQYYRDEVVIHIKETLPKFYYIYHRERVKRQYPAKKLWNSEDVYYEDYYKRIYKVEYTIPRIKKLGFLKTTFKYTDSTKFSANDLGGYLPSNSYLIEFYSAPYSAFLNRTFGVKLTYEYSCGEYKRAPEVNWSERKSKTNHYWAELDFYNQRKYLRIKPHFEYKKERHYPSYNTWYTIKSGIKVEKKLNGDLKYTADWTYIKYKRAKDPYNDPASLWPPNSLNTSCWTWENEIEYEIVRDLKLKFGLDYGNGLGFSAFDNIGGRVELQLRNPGLIDFRIGYRYIDYFNIDQGVDSVFFKLGWFI